MEERKKPYEVPTLTVVTFKTELGYATSGGRFTMIINYATEWELTGAVDVHRNSYGSTSQTWE